MEIGERAYPRDLTELNLVVLAQAEVVDGVLGPDDAWDRSGFRIMGIREHEEVMAATSGAAQVPVAPHIIDDGAQFFGSGNQNVVSALGVARHLVGVSVED